MTTKTAGFGYSLLLILWQASPGVCNAKRRHQSPEWMIRSHVNCFIQGEVVGFQVLLDSLHPRSTRTSWLSPPVLQGGSCYDLLGICCVYCIHAMWLNMKKCHAWTIAKWLLLTLHDVYITVSVTVLLCRYLEAELWLVVDVCYAVLHGTSLARQCSLHLAHHSEYDNIITWSWPQTIMTYG